MSDYDSYYQWFQEQIQNMMDHMPSNLNDNMDESVIHPGSEGSMYTAMAQDYHASHSSGMSERAAYIAECRAARG